MKVRLRFQYPDIPKITSSKWFLPSILSLPALGILVQAADLPWDKPASDALMELSGKTAIRMLILTLLITPARVLLPRSYFLLWLLRRRRYLGLASFFYVVIHLTIYLISSTGYSKVTADLAQSTYLFGWIAFLLILPLAATSNRLAVRRLGHDNWKMLHRLVYVVAAFAAAHWIFKVHKDTNLPVMLHFAPLLALEGYRIQSLVRDWLHRRPRRGK